MITNITIMRSCLIATVPSELNIEILNKIREDVLNSVQKREIHGVIFDLSAVRILDSFEFRYFTDIAKMTFLLGAESVFIGLRPGVVSSLVNTDTDLSQVRTFLNLESGFMYFELNSPKIQDDSEEENVENKDDLLDANDDMETSEEYK